MRNSGSQIGSVQYLTLLQLRWMLLSVNAKVALLLPLLRCSLPLLRTNRLSAIFTVSMGHVLTHVGR